MLAAHPEWEKRIRINKDTITVLGVATVYWRLEGVTPEEEVADVLPELEDAIWESTLCHRWVND